MANTLRTVFLLLLTMTFMAFNFSNIENQGCGNSLELVSSENERFTFKVSTSDSFESTLYVLNEGDYIKVLTLKGSNTQEIVFEDIQQGKIYKLITNYSTNAPLCATRQITGLTL